MRLSLNAPASADFDVLDVLIKIVDHLREDQTYGAIDRESGLKSADELIRVIKTKTGNRTITGSGKMGG